MKTLCLHCSAPVSAQRTTRKFCTRECGAAYRWKIAPKKSDEGHVCRACGKTFPIGPGQNQKWTCSDACRRARVAQITREFHLRNPEREALYRQRHKAKQLPDSNLHRFRRWNPNAPTACESCGETRVLDMAHKPGQERNGQWRSQANCRWPEMVWVLCPTCHALLDRMHYPPAELGLH